MKLLIFATLQEAESSINKLDAKQIEPYLYRFSQGHLVICGFGAFAAMKAVYTYGPHHTEIFNLGLAGLLCDKYPMGSLYSIEMVGKYTHLPADIDVTSKEIAANHLPVLSVNLCGLRLMTSDFPIHHQRIKEQLALHWDLVDMEGYGLVYAAHALKKPVYLWKITSDCAIEGGRVSLKKNLYECGEKLAEKLVVEIDLAPKNDPNKT